MHGETVKFTVAVCLHFLTCFWFCSIECKVSVTI